MSDAAVSDVTVSIAAHPLLDARVIVATYEKPLGEIASPESLTKLFSADAAASAPLQSSDAIRGAVRDLLRHGGYKPTGRGKPASEYLIRASTEGTLGSINASVDVCNAVSLHSGLPISVVDLDRAKGPFSIAIAPADATYVFNASGQTIDVEGLLCLCDADGPCANAVKDSQRTKTHVGTARTMIVIWGTKSAPGVSDRALDWYRELLVTTGAKVELALTS